MMTQKKQFIQKNILCMSLVLWILMAYSLSLAAAPKDKIIVFCAASTTNAINDICSLFFNQHHIRVVPSFASSSTLARQIENGAPAHIYLSANLKWMDYLDNQHMLESKTRINVLKNQIVLIAPIDSQFDHIKIEMNPLLAMIRGSGHLAMGDLDHVPAGIYGRQAMIHFGVWGQVKSKIVRTKDVRAALVLAARGEVPLAIVFSTDTIVSDQVKTIGIFPGNSHSPIVYPAAIISGKNTPNAQQFLNFLISDAASKVFKTYGFKSY